MARPLISTTASSPFSRHQVSVWVSVRRRTAAPHRLQPSLNPHVSASRDVRERAKAELESERPARDRGFESPHFRSADDIGPLEAEGLALAKAESVRHGSAGAGLLPGMALADRLSIVLRRRVTGRVGRRSAEVGLRPLLESVLDAELDGGVDVQLVQTVGFDPVHLLGLAARRERAADGAGAEAEGELLADLAVVVGDDVAGVGVDANQAGDLDVEPGFLADLADGGFGAGLADLLSPAGDGPQVIVGALDQQHSARVVEDDGGDGHDETVGPRGGRIVIVVGLGHAS